MKKEIESLIGQIGSHNNQITVLSQEIVKSKSTAKSLSREIERVQESIDGVRFEFEKTTQKYEDARLMRNKLDEKRK